MTLFREERAETLAWLRIVIPVLVLVTPGLREGARVAAWDHARFVVPEGLHWFVASIPINATVARGVEIATVFSAMCAAIGVYTRPALVVLTAGAFYLLSIAQLTGFVWHDMHVLWMCALLAASPCDHALAYDNLVPRVPSVAYGVPLAFARALLGAVYFFPGLHKLREQGLGWALSDNLTHQLWWKWAEHGVLPSFRIDLHPWLLHAGGLFVLAFEISAPLLFYFRKTRLFAALFGVVFHVLAGFIFLIPFAALWSCYVVLTDLRVQFPSRPPPPDEPARAWRASYVAGVVLLAGAIVAGARGQTQSYPFACYPTFQYDPGASMPDLRFSATLADGSEVDVPFARDANGYRSQRDWGTIFALAGVTHEVSAARLHAYFATLQQPPGVVRVRALRVAVSVDPAVAAEHRVLREEEIAAFTR